jgi:ribosome-binding protein aMBF1 (putative translation factor)
MSCGQEYRGSLYEVTDPGGQPMYVCARCKELLEQSAAHQAAAKQEAYEILGVEPGASQEDIEAAYRERAKEAHPDTGGSKQEFLEVQEAYETLSESMNS